MTTDCFFSTWNGLSVSVAIVVLYYLTWSNLSILLSSEGGTIVGAVDSRVEGSQKKKNYDNVRNRSMRALFDPFTLVAQN